MISKTATELFDKLAYSNKETRKIQNATQEILKSLNAPILKKELVAKGFNIQELAAKLARESVRPGTFDMGAYLSQLTGETFPSNFAPKKKPRTPDMYIPSDPNTKLPNNAVHLLPPGSDAYIRDTPTPESRAFPEEPKVTPKASLIGGHSEIPHSKPSGIPSNIMLHPGAASESTPLWKRVFKSPYTRYGAGALGVAGAAYGAKKLYDNYNE